LRLGDKKLNKFLFAVQGIGAVFVSIFLGAYLGGLLAAYLYNIPSTTVLHSEPAFRIPLIISGAVLLVLILSSVILAVRSKQD
jgi:hypothetical protein